MKKWYYIEITGEENITKYLNKLDYMGVKPEEIKITILYGFGVIGAIHYFSTDKISE